MNKIINLGVIGLGAIGERLIQSYHGRSDLQVVGICDSSSDRLKKIAEQFQIHHKFKDYKDLLEIDELDAIYVAVPPKYHEEIVLAAVKKEKHILCEKPLANSVDEAKNMVAAIKNSGLVHAMHFPLNYQSSLVQFEQMIKDGYIGELRRINLKMHFPHWPRLWQQNDWVASKEQGGFVLEVGVHWIQAILRIFGPITEVRSKLQFPDDPTLCETEIVAEMKLMNGTLILVDGLSNIGGEEHLEFAAYGSKGTLMLRNWRDLLGAKTGENLQEIPSADMKVNHLAAEFVKAINKEEAELYDFEVGFKAQKVLEALRNPPNDEWQRL